MGMDQYLLIPFLVGWTSIYQLFWCSPGVQGFDTLPYCFVPLKPLKLWCRWDHGDISGMINLKDLLISVIIFNCPLYEITAKFHWIVDISHCSFWLIKIKIYLWPSDSQIVCRKHIYIYIQRVFSLAFNWCCNGLGHQIRRRTKPIEENIWITWRSARKWRVAGIGLLLKIWLVCMLVVGWIKLVCPSTMHVLSGLRCSVVENPRNPRTWGSSSTAIDRRFGQTPSCGRCFQRPDDGCKASFKAVASMRLVTQTHFSQHSEFPKLGDG